MSKSFSALEKAVNFADHSSEIIGKTVSWMGLAMILVTMYEVVSRYVFNSPTDWAHESTTMLYGTFCILGGVWTLREKGHVRSEVVHQMMSPKLQKFCDILSGVIILLMFAVIFYATTDFAVASWETKEISSASTWGVPIYPFKTVLAIATLLMFFQQLANLSRDLLGLSKSKAAQVTAEH